jgi:peptidoglycan hydrolase-like protein with peptidoglycan-binding domain
MRAARMAFWRLATGTMAAWKRFGLISLMAFATAFPAAAQELLPPGAGFLTRFSGTVEETQADGTVRTVIDTEGASGIALDLGQPGHAPDGSPWRYPPELFRATAARTGQVFGVALDDAPQPNIYVTATSAFGLHRSADNSGWMAGMWGEDGGPGTIYRLAAADDYRPSIFARVTLDGRANSGAALGNIAYDRWNRQFFVSDLETGMIHRLRLADGFDAGHYDHGGTGRTDFFDAQSGERMALDAIGFDPALSARISDCPSGDFARDPSCWNVADFRRRVWGLGVRRDNATGEVRLFYAIWGSQGFGNPDYATADDDKRNSVWSVALAPDGDFDTASVRREFFLPDFFRSPEAIARAGLSQPVADIAFADYADQTVMLLAERGGLRNRGLDAEDSFAFPREARVLRYDLGTDGLWRPDGRYDVGYNDRQTDGPPYLRAGAAGGVAFGMGHDANGALEEGNPDAYVWMTGDGMCTPASPCPGGDENVNGLQGNATGVFAETEPAAAFQPYPSPGPATPPDGPNTAYMIDADLGAGDGNDATRIGDIAIYQSVPVVAEVPAEGPWYGPWPGEWPWPIPVPGGELPPPPPGEELPDLAIAKTTPPVCDWERECDFMLTVTNNGPGAYEGPLFVGDFATVGTYAGASPGWTCEQEGVPPAPVMCRHEPMTLTAGESAFLVLTFAMPAPAGPLPEWETWADNCAAIAWAGGLEDDARIHAVESALNLSGYDPGVVDGIADADTQAAIDAYRADNGLPPGGIDEELFGSLFPGSSGMAGDADDSNDFACAAYFLPGDDGLPPPPELETADLALHKTLLSDHCTPGAPCDFRITISNIGTEAFSGPVIFFDAAGYEGVGLVPAGAILPNTGGMGCADVGVAGRRCEMDGSPVHDLGPGDALEFDIRIEVPASAPIDTDLTNCGFIDWAAMGMVPVGDPGNDWECVDVPLLLEVVPVEAPVELAITKERIGPECERGSPCNYMISVRNIGAEDYEGPISFIDEAIYHRAPAPGLAEVGHLPAGTVTVLSPAVDCVPVEGGPVCTSIDPLRLEAGGAPVHFDLTYDVPADPDYTLLENCAEINWPAMAFPGGHDADASNDRMCVEVVGPLIEPVSGPELALEKDISVCGLETPETAYCQFNITVRNDGDAPFSDIIRIRDEVPGVARLTAHGHDDDPSWRCDQPGGDGAEAFCLSDEVIRLEPTEEKEIEIRLVMPVDAAEPGLENCAEIDWGGMAFPGGTDGNAANDRNCAPFEAAEPPAFDIAVSMENLDADCRPGGQCAYRVSLANSGPEPYSGVLAFRTWTLNGGGMTSFGYRFTPPDDWDCGPFGPDDDMLCSREVADMLGDGSTYSADISVDLPDDGRLWGDMVAISRLVWFVMGPVGDSDEDNDFASVAQPVAMAEVDLMPHGDTECVRGSSCLLDVRIDNTGDLQFNGAAGLRGIFDPAVTVESVTGETRGLKCSVTGDSGYECLSSSLTIDPGDSARMQVVIDIPAGFASDTITHTKDMVWPDAAVKNRNTENDRHVSTITIIDPAMLPAVDLAIAKTANQGSCTAGQQCGFSMTVTNNGPATFDGSIVISDDTDPTTRLTGSSPSDWSCRGANGRYACTLANASLAAGESRSLALTLATNRSARGTLTNCAEVSRNVSARVAEVQRALNAAGFNAGAVDGIAGRRTRAAISAYQEANGLFVTGEIDTGLLQSLLDIALPGDSNADNDRACATVQLIAPPVEQQPPAQQTQPVQPAQPREQPSTQQQPTQQPTVVRPTCPRGWQQVGPAQAALATAQGRRVMPVTKSGITILCAAPRRQQPAQACPRGFKQVTRAQAKILVNQGYEIRQVGNLLCARPR